MNEEIADLFEKELKRTDSLYSPKPKKDQLKNDTVLKDELSEKFFCEIEKILVNDSEYAFDSHIFFALLQVLQSPQVDSLTAKQVLHQIDFKFNQDLYESKFDENKTETYREKLRDVMKHFETLAQEYYYREIHSDIKNLDLPEKLSNVKRKLTKINLNRFERKAYEEVQKEIENDIAIQKEELLNRQQLSDSQKMHEEKEHSVKHKDLTLDRAVLFMEYLFRATKTSSFNKAKAEAISFLTGYSSETLRQRLSSINEEKNKKSSSFKKDLRIVRNLLDKLGLTEIVKDIDRDLQRL